MKDKDFILSIDFDGTIVENAYPKVGNLINKADYYINRLHEDCVIIINTCRSGEHEYHAERFLIDNKIKYDWFNHNDPNQLILYNRDCRKISADIYIDDKNLLGLPMINNNVDWETIYKIVKQQINIKNIKLWKEKNMMETNSL